MNRRTASLAAAALVLAGTLAVPQAPALADDPPGPSAGQVASAQAAAQAAQAQVDAVEARLLAARSAEQAMDVRVETAVEAYDGALLVQQRATVQAILTAAEAARANAEQAAAQEVVGEVAAEQYTQGGGPQLAGFAGLLTARDPHTAELAVQAAQGAAEEARRALQEAAAAAAQAAHADSAARQASAAAATATAKVGAARQAAQQQLAAQQAQVAALDAQHTALLSGLAETQRAALQLAEARATALAAQVAKLAALAKQPPAQPPAPKPGDTRRVLAFARSALGLPYVWGGAGPQNYDCSGLTMRAWQRAGVQLPHFAADQYADSHPVTYRQLQPGDLVFWSHDGSPQGIYHVALFVGDDTVIEAPRTGDVVKTASLWIMGTPDFYARP